ncbi:glutathione S-transferase N-terminal domain-containing protein [Paraburkholderia xenovorans]|uniref:glutathione S-transferase family protein n=1 Tax=Paraburkholderia xenovorans TaxID=36873 RepID=UPI0038BCF66A
MAEERIKVWGRLNSANVQKVLWCLADLGLRFEFSPTGGEHGGVDSQAFRKLNPNGLVPVIEDNDIVLWESNVIVRYLFRRYAPRTAYHEDPVRQALDERWSDWYGTELGVHMTALWGFVKRGRPLPAEAFERHRSRAMALWGILDQALDGVQSIGGTELSTSDYVLGPALHRWINLDIPRDATPRLSKWYSTLCERPAYRQYVVNAPY